MSKAHRGKGIRDQYAHGRGECPVCKRNNVKILYEQEAGEQKFKICKTCRAAIKSGKRSLPVATQPAAPAEKATPAEVPVTAEPVAEAPAPAVEEVDASAAEVENPVAAFQEEVVPVATEASTVAPE